MKQLTLKQAIMKLPEVDKRWKNISQSCAPSYFAFGGSKTKLALLLHLPETDIAKLHAAAKTLGYEIWWEPLRRIDSSDIYEAHGLIIDRTGIDTIIKECANPAKAIQAAFIWCVEQRLKEGK